MMKVITWTCHICKTERPDSMISVYTRDISADFKLPSGTVTENIRYCNDRSPCISASRVFSFIRNGGTMACQECYKEMSYAPGAPEAHVPEHYYCHDCRIVYVVGLQMWTKMP